MTSHPRALRTDPCHWQETVGEQIANTVTHGIGAVLSVAGLVLLVVRASLNGTTLDLAALSLYGGTLVLLYFASTLYHAVRGPRTRQICRMLDHGAIFLLIAGTYTPFALISLGGVRGWGLFVVIWGLAVTGVLLKIFRRDEWPRGSLVFYLAMGWLMVVAVGDLIAALGMDGFLWLALGGLAYTGGVVFYLWDRLPFNHAVWHLFVLTGSACHFIAVLFYVAPRAA